MSQKPYMWNGNNPVAYGDPSGYATIIDDGENVSIVILVHFVPGASGDTSANEKAFVSNTERRLSGNVGHERVITTVVPVRDSGKGTIEVKLQDPGAHGNPHVNGGPGGYDRENATTNANSYWSKASYPDATAGSQAHELFHNLSTA